MTPEGYEIFRDAVPYVFIDSALRRIHTRILEKGISVAEIAHYRKTSHWLIDLACYEEIMGLHDFIPVQYRQGERSYPQIVLQFPSTNITEKEFHVDKLNPGDKGVIRYICGFALSRQTDRNGGIHVLPKNSEKSKQIMQDPGDLLIMDGDLQHTPGFNRSGNIRYAVYFRYVERE
jgi:hypothetical protein